MSTAHPILTSIDWVALDWVLGVNRLPRNANPVHEDRQLLQLWHRVGTTTGTAGHGKKLQQLVIEWGGIPTARRVILGTTYPTVVMVPLFDAFIVTQQTGVRPKAAAMQVVRDYSANLRRALLQALIELRRGRLGDGLQNRLSVPNQSQATVLCNIGEALDLLMRDIEDHVYGVSKATMAGLLGA